ncbi:hypothetical protein FVER14953_21494 [Fusarium verticillioides]|nr:hypothetical protein FVER14953_21494 [Fusarium verticillioides]
MFEPKPDDETEPEPAKTSTSPTPTKPSNGIKTPGPLQPDIVSDCDDFYMVQKGDGCASVAEKHGITLAQFNKWNPSAGDNCSGLWADAYACVSVIGHKSTPTKPSPTNGIKTPSPIQNGIAKDCNKFHLVTSTTTCTSIKDYYKLPLNDFLKWNPAVGKDCKSLLVDYWVCVSIVNYKPTPTKPAAGNGIKTPSPIQEKMTKDCDKFHQIKSTTTCSSIESYYKLPLETFYKWNPAVGNKCQSLLTDYWVCVRTINYKPTPTNPDKGNGISTPSAIQSGMTKNCNKFHPVKATTTCSSIQESYKITMEDIYKWNPAVGAKCTGLWVDTNICVGVIGQKPTPTKPATGIKTPSPIQNGLTKSCKKFHFVDSKTTCSSIQSQYRITLANLVKWNPAIGSSCKSLWAKYWVCVGV